MVKVTELAKVIELSGRGEEREVRSMFVDWTARQVVVSDTEIDMESV